MDDIEKLEIKDALKTKILKFILYKKRTEKEVRIKFADENENLLEDIIEELKEQEYLNDSNYIERAVNEFLNLKNLSIKEIQYKLYQKGIEKSLIDEYTCNNKEKMLKYEINSVISIALKKKNHMEKREIIEFLYKKGYTSESIDIGINEGNI